MRKPLFYHFWHRKSMTNNVFSNSLLGHHFSGFMSICLENAHFGDPSKSSGRQNGTHNQQNCAFKLKQTMSDAPASVFEASYICLHVWLLIVMVVAVDMTGCQKVARRARVSHHECLFMLLGPPWRDFSWCWKQFCRELAKNLQETSNQGNSPRNSS